MHDPTRREIRARDSLDTADGVLAGARRADTPRPSVPSRTPRNHEERLERRAQLATSDRTIAFLSERPFRKIVDIVSNIRSDSGYPRSWTRWAAIAHRPLGDRPHPLLLAWRERVEEARPIDSDHRRRQLGARAIAPCWRGLLRHPARLLTRMPPRIRTRSRPAATSMPWPDRRSSRRSSWAAWATRRPSRCARPHKSWPRRVPAEDTETSCSRSPVPDVCEEGIPQGAGAARPPATTGQAGLASNPRTPRPRMRFALSAGQGLVRDESKTYLSISTHALAPDEEGRLDGEDPPEEGGGERAHLYWGSRGASAAAARGLTKLRPYTAAR